MTLEKTVIIIKHDGIQKGVIGEVIQRFEKTGLRLAGMKMVQADKELAEQHYQMTEDWIKKLGENTKKAAAEKGIELKETNKEIAARVRKWNVEYLTEGPVIVIVFEGPHAIEIGRKLVGHAEPRQAELGTIRGDHAVDSYEMADTEQRSLRNLVHASGNKEEAENELKIWFSIDEIHHYKK